jgi:hypothetical protein
MTLPPMANLKADPGAVPVDAVGLGVQISAVAVPTAARLGVDVKVIPTPPCIFL